jgi:sialic acid synthase SpsE/quercetin dioxygenase-like cupin family protein
MKQTKRPFFIFEIANNHQGSVEHGKRIISAMGKISERQKIDAAVKFQFRDLDTFVHPDFQGRDDIKHVKRFESTRLSSADFKQLIDHTKELGMKVVITPFDEPSVVEAIRMGTDFLKVASCSSRDWPLLEEIAKHNFPVIASTGGTNLNEIDNLVSFFTHKDIALRIMHCVSIYPTPLEKLHMGFLKRLQSRFPGIDIGYSGHEAPDELMPVVSAVSMGARLFERHVGVPTEEWPNNKYSMNPEETEKWVESAKSAMSLCGDFWDKEISDSERTALQDLERGVFVNQEIGPGSSLKPSQVFYAFPRKPGQVSSGEFGTHRVNFKTSKSYEKNSPLTEPVPVDSLNATRKLIHDAKGLLSEAGIPLGPAEDYTVELSHHFGMAQFGKVGATIVNLINRAYCKKLVIVLPGQDHPVHKHKVKDETFQLLHGDLTATLDGTTVVMKPGDKLLVKPGQWHSFKSEGGAVFEEVSTTHVRGDSVYQDERIARLDPMERKTLLDEW